MRTSIKILGWAVKGEPVLNGPGSTEFFLQLSSLPDAVWQRAFRSHADPLSHLHGNDVVYQQQGETLRIWCPVRALAACVESAKQRVSSANIDAIEFDQKVNGLKLRDADRHEGDWAGIEEQRSKIGFD